MNMNAATPQRMRAYIKYGKDSATDLAALFADIVNIVDAKSIYENVDTDRVIDFERKNQSKIYDFLLLNAKHRRAQYGQFTKFFSEEDRVLFFVLAMIGTMRSIAMLELNDKFRWAAGPGRSYATTLAGNYDFSNCVIDLKSYAWPTKFFPVV